jgi:uncharacterized protein (TIGR02001 family)
VALALWPAAPAAARIGATVSAFSDERFRGYSLSDGRPVGIFDFAYDDSSGFYADASATGVLRRGGRPTPLGAELSTGYAKRLSSGTTVDFGAVYSRYSHYSRGETGKSYAELYAGIARGGLSSRIFLSPHYSRAGLWTAYGEINGSVSPERHWSLDAHAGMLVPLRTPQSERYGAAFDLSLGVTRELGRLSLHGSLVEGARGRDYYGERARGGPGAVIGASCAL